MKISYDVPITSGTKLKKHKVRNELIQTFLNKILDRQQVSQKIWNIVSFHDLKLVAFKTSGLKNLKLCLNFLNVPMLKTFGCICRGIQTTCNNLLQLSK